jgi:hypothetical protein
MFRMNCRIQCQDDDHGGNNQDDSREVDFCGANTALKLTPNTLVLDSTMCLFRSPDQIICHLPKRETSIVLGKNTVS